jgi:hypothetical protein
MNSQDYSFSVGEIEFVIRVDFTCSIKRTNAYRGDHGSDYAFVVACILIRQNENLVLLQDEWDVYNLIVWLSTLENSLSKPIEIPAELGISAGKVSNWWDDYWQKIEDETVTAADESTYQLLSKALFTSDSKNGHIAAYAVSGYAYLEVVARTDSKCFHQVSTFSTDESALSVHALREEIGIELARKLVITH